jgi:hypothetical protein
MMATKVSDTLGKAFIEFWRSQGVTFVDGKTGKEISVEEEE